MSAFLGPIHTWLYNKIKFQDAMTDAILDLAEENGYSKELRTRTDSRYGVLEKGNLEDMIDTGNIHGWLQEKVSLVENRLAYVVTELLEPDQERLSHIIDAVLEFGKRNSADKNITVRKGYDYLESTLLNGMPCDRVNELIQESEDKLVWRQTQDIHGAYWAMIRGDVTHYYALRESLIKGMFEDSELEFHQIEDQVYELRRRLCTE
ncbi:MAG TPA: hypothetical protein DEQ64_18490 [Lachnoclostridium sp.]|jgi:hypothetical protein|uniref:hypothetical protein n=2 Tax=Lacrimispora sp. TaxID=2719234 RepID=UPI000EBA204D|nr:hypothetical protein [Lacrimispora sp.]HCD45672.1 hypothetical protein [Lachnoclostridium sp.]